MKSDKWPEDRVKVRKVTRYPFDSHGWVRISVDDNCEEEQFTWLSPVKARKLAMKLFLTANEVDADET